MSYAPESDALQWTESSADACPWRPAFEILLKRLRRGLWMIVAAGLAGGVIGAIGKLAFPSSYTATTQLLFDPRGLKVFSNELTSGLFDANSAINFVESQMSVILSESVLTRVVERECAARKAAKPAGSPERAPPLSFTRLCPNSGQNGDAARATAALRRAVAVKRAERSFVVDVSATETTPPLAARLAGAVVAAYIEEDAATRAESAARLTSDLSARLDALRRKLHESQGKAEIYRRDKNLVRVGDKLLVEQMLADATSALNAAQSRTDRARARVKQLEQAPKTASALGALGADADTRTLQALMERRAATLVEIAPLAARMGERHPVLMEARSRLAEADRGIAAEMTSIRSAARADLTRAKTEQDGLARTVTELSAKVGHARQAEIELRTLEQEVDANSKLLESFETRSREAGEFGRIDSGNLRVVSVARAPEAHRLLTGLILWGVVGLVLGVMLAGAGFALAAVFGLGGGENDSEPDDQEMWDDYAGMPQDCYDAETHFSQARRSIEAAFGVTRSG